MKLPNGDLAEIPTEKLLGYLLSRDHEFGKWKAKALAKVGYWPRNWTDLREALLGIAREGEVAQISFGPHGTTYVLDGYLGVDTERKLLLRTVWIVRQAGESPRFVTAFPRRAR